MKKVKDYCPKIRWFKNGTVEEIVSESETHQFIEYSLFHIVMFSIFNFGWAFLIGFVGSVMFPKDIITLIGDEYKQVALGIVLGIAAFIQFIIGPIIGNVADRSKLIKFKNFEIGKRKPYIIVGTILYVSTIFIRAFFRWESCIWCFICYSIVGILGNSFSVIGLTAYTALFPDLFHPSQYDVVSAVLGFSQLLGGALSVGVFGFFWSYIPYFLIVSIVVILGLVTSFPVIIFKEEYAVNALLGKDNSSHSLDILVNEDEDEITDVLQDNNNSINEKNLGRKEKKGIVKTLNAVWTYIKQFVKPFKSRNFMWVFLARFIFMFSIASLQSFLLYFLRDSVKDLTYEDYPIIAFHNIITTDEQAQAVTAVTIFFFGLLSSFSGPILSKKIHRKYVVMLAGIIMIIALLAFIISRNFTVILLFSPLMGTGMGAFYAVDMALVNEVLPNKDETAKDLAIFSIATVVPFAVAGPAMGGLITLGNELVSSIRGFGYFLLFGFAIFVQIIGSIVVTFVKNTSKKKNEHMQQILDEMEIFDEEKIDSVLGGNYEDDGKSSLLNKDEKSENNINKIPEKLDSYGALDVKNEDDIPEPEIGVLGEDHEREEYLK